MSTKNLALIFSIVMVFSSFVGCIDTDEDDATITDSDTNLGNVLVSTYHVGELVKAVGGDRITVEIISPSNVPVHDYEPSAADLIKLQETDLFFYHGLNLEPWVDSTVSSLGSDAPLVVRTHAMPSGENTLDYQSMLLSKICETLNEDAYEAVTLADHHDEAGDVTIHAEAMTHKVSYPEMDEDDHDDHDDHEDHNHAEAEKVIENPSDCPSDTSVSIFHLEEGEYLLEFEYGESTDFDMVVLKMAGGHAHHHHDHGDEDDHDDHGDEDVHDDHDEHGDDHDDHDDDHHEEMSQLIAIFNESDANNDGFLNLTELEHFLPLVVEFDDHDDHDDHHNDEDEGHHHHGDEDYHHQHSDDDTSSHADYDRHHNHSHDDDIDGDDVPTPQEALNFTDANNDSLMSWDEFWHAWEDEDDGDEHDGHGDEHDDHKEDPVAFATLHIEEEGDYGFALPSGIEHFILMGEGGHDDHSDHGHGDHGDEHAVCHDTTNHVNTEHDNKADCEAAGHMWMEDHDEGPCHDMNTHNSTEHDNKADCEAAGHLWMGDHSDGGSEIVAGDEEEAFEYDPHSWLSPVAYKAQLNVVLESLVTVFPDGEADFRANAEAYSAELDKLDLDYTAAFGAGGTCEVKNAEKMVVANHNAYAYISERYDIEILTVHGLDPEGEPSAADIAEVVEQIEEKGITVLYVEEYTDTSSVDSIAQQTGVTIEILYTMELPPKNSEDTYLTLMSKNLDSLVTGMGC